MELQIDSIFQGKYQIMLYFTFSKRSPSKIALSENNRKVQQPSTSKPIRPCRQAMSMVLVRPGGYCSSCPQPVRSLGPK